MGPGSPWRLHLAATLLLGAVLAASHSNWHAIVWAEPAGQHWWQWNGIVFKVIIPMVVSPLFGLVAAFFVAATRICIGVTPASAMRSISCMGIPRSK